MIQGCSIHDEEEETKMTTIDDPPYIYRLRLGVLEWFEALTAHSERRRRGITFELGDEKVTHVTLAWITAVRALRVRA